MKKFSTGYLEWAIQLSINLTLLCATSLAVCFAINYRKKYEFDLSGYTLTAVAVIAAALVLWETIVLIDFIAKDVNATVGVDRDSLTVMRAKKVDVYSFKDLKQIEHVLRRVGSRSLTARFTYSRLTFGQNQIVITSFTMPEHERHKFFSARSAITRTRERKFFELVA